MAHPPLATPEQARRITGQPFPDEHQACLAMAVASAAVRNHCGWPISEHTADVVVDGDGGQILQLPCLHLTDVDAVEIHGRSVHDWMWSATGQLHRAAGWPAGFRSVRVVYTAGYGLVPDEVVAVVCTLASMASTPSGVAGWTVGGQTVTFTQGGSSAASVGENTPEEAVLARYRLANRP